MLDKKYNHALIILYLPIFLFCFFWLEGRTDITEHLIHSPLDDMIPFVEFFIIPYLLWFPYLLGTVFYLLYYGGKGEAEKREFYQFAYMLIAGLTISLITYVIWPSTLMLRPEIYPRNNIFTSICAALQGFDTPSNVCPSMHVYSSVVVFICLRKNSCLKNKKAFQFGSLILMILICLSTMFIKQHSVIDVLCALFMNLLLYLATYHLAFKPKSNQLFN